MGREQEILVVQGTGDIGWAGDRRYWLGRERRYWVGTGQGRREDIGWGIREYLYLEISLFRNAKNLD